ncbi:aminopeptidase N C-terminal domain-containing protein [Rickettsiella massiliensis]|uniref:aminopeptidase N C-terminal domain-containing protein n=1 Tax=Rickettsiella massiliensis TaxID=676517 RepID=UPI000A05D0C3|nr:aminopeptidase N C-terminal domain-containing protein [Rickettsiella massiliensis]
MYKKFSAISPSFGKRIIHFLTEQILRLDQLNPQLAARFVKPFTRWRRFDETRRELMKQQLETLLHTTSLSTDVYELVSKTLVC